MRTKKNPDTGFPQIFFQLTFFFPKNVLYILLYFQYLFLRNQTFMPLRIPGRTERVLRGNWKRYSEYRLPSPYSRWNRVEEPSPVFFLLRRDGSGVWTQAPLRTPTLPLLGSGVEKGGGARLLWCRRKERSNFWLPFPRSLTENKYRAREKNFLLPHHSQLSRRHILPSVSQPR